MRARAALGCRRWPASGRYSRRDSTGRSRSLAVSGARVRLDLGDGVACAAPSKRNPVTFGSQRRRTKYSWNARSPSAVSTMVRTGSSLIGRTACCTPSRAASCRVTMVKRSPRSRSCRRSRCRARSLSPSLNQVSPPRRPTSSITAQLSAARPQPVSRLSTPESVYITVSTSGQILRPKCSKSSPVFTMTARSCGGSTCAKP